MCCFRRYNNCGCQRRCCRCYTTCYDDANASGSCCGNTASNSCCSSGNASYRNGYNDGYAAGCQAGYQNGYEAGIANCIMPLNGNGSSTGCGCSSQPFVQAAESSGILSVARQNRCRNLSCGGFRRLCEPNPIHKLLTFCSNIVYNFSKFGTQTLSILITIETKYFSRETVIFFS